MFPKHPTVDDFRVQLSLFCGSAFIYTPLVAISCLQYKAGVDVKVFGMGQPDASFGLVPTAGLSPSMVLAIYILVSAIIVVDLFFGVRGLINIHRIGETMLKELREVEKDD